MKNKNNGYTQPIYLIILAIVFVICMTLIAIFAPQSLGIILFVIFLIVMLLVI